VRPGEKIPVDGVVVEGHFSIEEIRQLVALWHDRDRASAEVKKLALVRAADLDRKARQLDEMRRSLEHLAASCHDDDRPDCPILGNLEESEAS
jgi:MerR family copper efflux transcriptional regulator